MKNKKFVVGFMALLFGTLCSNAQSSLEKKLRADLEQSKKHREAVLLKAQEQQRQRQDEKRSEMILNTPQQNSSNANQNSVVRQQTNQNSTPATKEQPIINKSTKKEDINQ
jgi:hypothetical protein